MKPEWILSVLLLGLVPASWADCSLLPVEKRMEYEKRAPLPVVEPVVQEGTRYEEAQFEKSDGLDQNSGYLAAFDVATGKRKWVLKVYEVCYDNDDEGDVQDVFFKKLELGADGETLYVTNEEERRFAVDLVRRTVTEVGP